jgi:hypothetical protein
MTRQEEIVKGFNESWSQYGINVSSNISNPINGITVNNPNGGRAVALNFIDGVNATKLTAAQIAALPNPQAGQIVYQTDGSTGLYVYDGASWSKAGGLSSVIGTTNRITVTGGNTIDIASTYVGQTSITTLGTITTGTWTGIIGQATMTLGSDATGDIYYRNSGGNLTRLGIGSSGQVLGVSAGLPAWQASGSGITVGSTTITSGTSGRIGFNSSGVYGESANLFWNNSTNIVSIGTSLPAYTFGGLWLQGTYASGARNSLVVNTGSQSAYSDLLLTTNSVNSQITALRQYGTSGSPVNRYGLNLNSWGHLYFPNNGNLLISSDVNSTYVVMATESEASASNIFFYGGAKGISVKNTTTTPTAYLHIGAGVATTGGAPLKLTSGTNLTTPENGAFEFDGTSLYFTVGGVRKTVTLL